MSGDARRKERCGMVHARRRYDDVLHWHHDTERYDVVGAVLLYGYKYAHLRQHLTNECRDCGKRTLKGNLNIKQPWCVAHSWKWSVRQVKMAKCRLSKLKWPKFCF